MIFIATKADFDALGRVMYEAIRHGPSPYTQAQRAAWIDAPPLGPAWHDKLAAQFVVVGFDAGKAAGFMTLRADGYLDLAYIVPAARGAKMFQSLYAQIERHAITQGLQRIWVDASLMAQPAFAAVGFDIVRHDVVERSGQHLARAEMQKRLSV
jgi:putative acetyltransferase